MKLLAEEPKNAIGHDHPGTVKQIYEDEDSKKHYIKIFDNSPEKVSEHFILITKNN